MMLVCGGRRLVIRDAVYQIAINLAGPYSAFELLAIDTFAAESIHYTFT